MINAVQMDFWQKGIISSVPKHPINTINAVRYAMVTLSFPLCKNGERY